MIGARSRSQRVFFSSPCSFSFCFSLFSISHLAFFFFVPFITIPDFCRHRSSARSQGVFPCAGFTLRSRASILCVSPYIRRGSVNVRQSIESINQPNHIFQAPHSSMRRGVNIFTIPGERLDKVYKPRKMCTIPQYPSL